MNTFRDGRGRVSRFWAGSSLPIKILAGLGLAAAFAGLLGLVGWVFLSLWNALMPGIFGLPRIGYWQGWGLMILASMLFKRGPGGHRFAEERRKRRLRDRMRQAAEDLGSPEPEEGGAGGSRGSEP